MPITGRALYILGMKNPLRKAISFLINHPVFDNVIIFFIIVSTLTLAFEEPMEDPKRDQMKVIETVDLAMTIVFTLEALLKIMALGFLFNGGHSYLRNPWNILDFSIVIFALVSMTFDGADISFIKVLRIARILRPLRLISRA